MAVVADENDGAFILGKRVDQGFARVDVEMVGRFVEDQEVRGVKCREAQKQACFLAAREIAALRFGLVAAEAKRAEARAPLRFGWPPASS